MLLVNCWTVIDDRAPFLGINIASNSQRSGLTSEYCSVGNGQYYPPPTFINMFDDRRTLYQPGVEKTVVRATVIPQKDRLDKGYYPLLTALPDLIESHGVIVQWIIDQEKFRTTRQLGKMILNGEITVIDESALHVPYEELLLFLLPGSSLTYTHFQGDVCVSWNGTQLVVSR